MRWWEVGLGEAEEDERASARMDGLMWPVTCPAGVGSGPLYVSVVLSLSIYIYPSLMKNRGIMEIVLDRWIQNGGKNLESDGFCTKPTAFFFFRFFLCTLQQSS